MNFFDNASVHGPTFVIAEIGANHDGDFSEALRLMDVAAKARADAVKFQSVLADLLVKKDSPDYLILKKIELPHEWYPRLKKEAADRGLKFFSTATNDITLGWLRECGAELYKVASPNLTNLPLIEKVAAFGKPLVISTGMASLRQIDEAVETVRAAGNEDFCLLHCVSEYPAKPETLNLRFIETLATLYSVPAGFSDHSLEIGTAVAAVALGARVIEKHITSDRTRSGPDHHYALEPRDFIEMVHNIRTVEQALGSQHKVISSIERSNAQKYWRSLHAAKPIAAGEAITNDHISIIRPNDGLHPRHLRDVIGLRAKNALREGEAITWQAFKD